MNLQHPSLLYAVLILSAVFELAVGLAYCLDTEKQILRIRRTPCDSMLTRKYAKSFGIALICLSLLSLYTILACPAFQSFMAFAVIWTLYHALTVWNNILHLNRADIVVHGGFALLFVISGVLFFLQ